MNAAPCPNPECANAVFASQDIFGRWSAMGTTLKNPKCYSQN